jgi:hypothetical protein
MVSREVALWKGACSPSTSHVPFAPSRGARHDVTHAGGRSLAEKRLGEAVAFLKISRCMKAKYGGLFRKLK